MRAFASAPQAATFAPRAAVIVVYPHVANVEPVEHVLASRRGFGEPF
jgi:hypothetical protein